MKKTLPAFLAAFVITLCVAAGMFLVGSSALMNKNGVQASNSISSGVSDVKYSSADQAKIQQLQSLVAQYQQRDKQYQDELAKAAQQLQQQDAQLQQAGAQLQQVQMLLQALQQRGLITIDGSGRIFLPGD